MGKKTKKVLVVSHERSGTHFLMNSIAINFGYDLNKIDVYAKDSMGLSIKKNEQYKKNIKKFFFSNYNKKTSKIYKSHHQVGFVEPYLEDLLEHFEIFYIVRDPRDTITSCYHYFHKANVSAFPLPKSVEDLFFKIRPYEYPFDGAYSLIKSENFLVRWITHVKGWLDYGGTVNIVKYTDLKTNYQSTIKNLSVLMEKPIIQPIIQPDLTTNTISPRKGIEGDWKNYISDGSNEIICELVREAGLGEFIVKT